ncbi:hypothetical protein BGZ95_004841 [Linnemannia exigua]|uniref:Autophagy-related protein 29 n=1 Tax=Linnemannia exigua TaxID=604196 RepID=A0AAD4DH41_9FUNG|nr:hypothetical protein BGZ95_004841 [Linnemannia exigua]
MDSLEEPIHVIIRLPYPRPEGFVDSQPVQWTEAMESTLWKIIRETKPSLVDWNAVSRQLGNVPVPFLIRHSAYLYQNQLQDLHRLGEQQDLHALSRPTSRATIGPGTTTASLESNSPPQQPAVPGIHQVAESPPVDSNRTEEREPSFAGRKEGSFSGQTNNGSSSSNNVYQTQETNFKAQASPSLSTSISTFPSYARPASMSSSASTIRPVQPSSPSPSMRNTGSSQQALFESNMYNSGILSNRGQTQPKSTRGSQLIGTTFDRRPNTYTSNLPTSPRDEGAQADNARRIHEPAHPFHHATISASSHSSSPSGQDAQNLSTFQDYDRSSTVSSVSTPYSQSNSASQIFEETSFFNQLSSNDSLSRGQQHQQLQQQQYRADQLSREGEHQSSSLFRRNQGIYGLGFIGNNPSSSAHYHQSEHGDDEDDTDGDHTDKDDDGSSQDESGPLREQIKQLKLEDVLAFLPVGGSSASGMLQRPAEDGYQRKTASGDKMPFQLDDELANLGTGSLGEILGHDGGDEDDGERVKGIRFKDSTAPSRLRGLGRDGDSHTKVRVSPERSGPNSQKSSAHNSVGSSFSDLSDSSVTQSAMEDAYLSGYNNSKM